MGSKGVSGKILTMVIGLVVAIAALIILWVFLQDAMPFVTNTVDMAVAAFKRMICDSIPPVGDFFKTIDWC